MAQAVALRELRRRLAMNPTGDPQAHAQCRALVCGYSATYHLPRSASAPSRPTSKHSHRHTSRRMRSPDAPRNRTSAATSHWTSCSGSSRSREFTRTSETPREVLFRRAQRLVLAIERLSVATLPPTQREQPQTGLDTLRDDLRSPAAFDPPRFADMLAEFRMSLTRAEP
ncbi:MAG TPA: hypothetical protein VK993_01895 [Chthoniobacterales bacterium]|nr:hypothetical protein [Chthoniobacterales bacterium]